MNQFPLTVTDPAGGNPRHAAGVHVVPIRPDGKILLGLRSGLREAAAGPLVEDWSARGFGTAACRLRDLSHSSGVVSAFRDPAMILGETPENPAVVRVIPVYVPDSEARVLTSARSRRK